MNLRMQLAMVAVAAPAFAGYVENSLQSLLTTQLSGQVMTPETILATSKEANGRDTSYTVGPVDIYGLPTEARIAVIFGSEPLIPEVDVLVDRNFHEYLQQTLDRESMERARSEN